MELTDWTPLALAVLARDAAAVAQLLEGGVNPNERFLDMKVDFRCACQLV